MSENLFAKINEITLCYQIRGDGDPAFLIHGFGAKKEFWIGQVSELAKHLKLIMFDLRGAGKSSRPDTPYTMKMLVDDLNGLMDFLDIQRAHLIGHSLGSMIVQNFALNYPERINKLVLLGTLLGIPDEKGLEMFINNQIAIYEARLKDPINSFYNKMKLRLTRGFLKLMEQDPKFKFHDIFSAEDLINMEGQDPWTPQDIRNHSNALGEHKTLNLLQEIRSKTLIIAGEKDRLTPKVSSIQVHKQIQDSTLEIISAGHWFPLEKAPEVNQIILDFLKT
ncbi:MAG: alpha/beta fold hydrolase [Candidatus Hermodarchaeota archaeon]